MRRPRPARSLAIIAAVIAIVSAAHDAVAQKAPPPTRGGATGIAPSDTTVAARIMAEIRDHQTATSDLLYLTSTIGQRLTGSEHLLHANAWAESTFKARGFTNVHLEPYDFGPSWTRGQAYARLLTGSGSTLSIASLAWSPPTKGLVRADAILLSAKTVAGIDSLSMQVKGRIALAGQLPRIGDPGIDSVAQVAAVKRLGDALASGAIAYLRSAGRSTGLNMTGGPVWRSTFPPRMPYAFVESKDFNLMARSLLHGDRVTLELNLPSTTSPAPVRPNNTVAEIRGSEKPDEVVIIGAHLDSWDLGTGATDNGTGTVAVMEAARAIKALGLVPKRTIRVVLFSGEEQGEFGSKAYVAAHASELANVQAVLVHDLGTGKVRGWALQGREDARPLMAAAIAPMNDMGVWELPLERGDDSDHAPFAAAGVPAFFAVQDTVDYFSVTHHSQYDTYDHVRPDDLKEGAMVIAVTAWELANMPDRLRHVAPRTR